MEAMNFEQVYGRTWCDAWGFVKYRRRLALGMVTLMLLLGLMAATTPIGHHHPTTVADLGRHLLRALLHLLLALVGTAFKLGLVVQVSRYVLLGERTPHAPFFGPAFWRYLLVLTAGTLVYAVGVLIVTGVIGVSAAGVGALTLHGVHLGHARASAVFAIVVTLLVILAGSVIVFAPYSLLLTQAAAGRRLSVSAAWSDARRHARSMLFYSFATVLPLTLLTLPLIKGSGMLAAWVLPGTPVFPGPLVFAALAHAMASVFGMCINGACSAWLYRRYASRLLTA